MLASASLSLSLCFYLSLCFLVATGYKQYVGTLRKRQWSPSPDSSGPPPLYAGKVTGKSAKPSIEETIGLESSFKEDSFLKNIREYGNNRMARRAVGVLQKMPSFRVTPTAAHYNEVLWACEKGDQYKLALSVLEEMVQRGIPLSVNTYEALISAAEKTDHCAEAIDLFNKMIEEGISGTTFAYNACMMAHEKMGSHSDAWDLLNRMNELGIERDVVTYNACAWAAEKQGDGQLVLLMMKMMKEEGIEITTTTFDAAMWACTKEGSWEMCLKLFDQMEAKGIKKSQGSYNAAIWSSEMGERSMHALQLLRLMKFEDGLARQTMSFDGVLSALYKVGDWEQLVEVLKWMERDFCPKSHVTYKLAIDALDRAHKTEMIDEIYLKSLRDGFYSPWIPNTRALDVRSYSLAVAKVSLKIVLLAMKEGRLTIFPLQITVADVIMAKDGSGQPGEILDNLAEFDVDALVHFLVDLDLHVTLRSRVEYDENDLIMKYTAMGKGLGLDKLGSDGRDENLLTFVPLEVERAYRPIEVKEGEGGGGGRGGGGGEGEGEGPGDENMCYGTEVLTISIPAIKAWVACQNDWDS